MCGIAGIINLTQQPVDNLSRKLDVLNELIAHRGPDDAGTWQNQRKNVGLAHRRLSIIDLSEHGHQPMIGENNNALVFNGEIYNFQELREDLSGHWNFRSHTDTETILASYAVYKEECLQHLRGMFAFALWNGEALFCARDRFGIKPFYYTVVNNQFIFASEAKALLPFVEDIKTDRNAFSEYITFQYTIGEHTLFSGIKQLLPGHALIVRDGNIRTWRYWDVCYDMDFRHSDNYFQERLEHLLDDSITHHLRSDVDVGCYVSGGIDSSLISILASEHKQRALPMFHGRFMEYPGYDESPYAQTVAAKTNGELHIADITADDFIDAMHKTVYHLDYPVAGPGSFPQYMVSKLASQHVKVVLGGQGGDEIFGGYARYVLAYFEQCIKAAIEGNYKDGNFVVTAESILPNLGVLREYKPLIRSFWQDGLFEKLDKRYFRLINRSTDIDDELRPGVLDMDYVYQQFSDIFNSEKNFRKVSYFDSMTHFDFKCLLPGLLHVEDRMSMAHGLEARVPFLDHPLIEFMAIIPADIKFKDGQMKYLLKKTFANKLPQEITQRRDKMGFPVPLTEWAKGSLRNFFLDTFENGQSKHRDFIDYQAVLSQFHKTGRFSRKLWGFLCYELWQQQFHDKAAEYRKMIS